METPAIRRRTMQAVKSRDTAPELLVRRLLHSLGYRYRLYADELASCPDIVFRSRRKVIFIHGCFWHGHNCARGARIPKTNTEYWRNKVARNRARDLSARSELKRSGWAVLVLWECELRDEAAVTERLVFF